MAVSLTEAQLEAALGVSPELAARLLPVAVELVQRFAPAAPDSVANESVIRCSGWLAERPNSSLAGEKYGDVELSFAVGQLSALRHSGAMALLSPWKVRRGGVV